MTKFVLSVRHRPTMDETIEACFERFLDIVRHMPAPWGLRAGKELKLPPVGAGLSTTTKLRGKLGTGIAGMLTLSYRAPANLRDVASHDDSLIIEFDESKVAWRQLVDDGMPGYVQAIGAYLARLYRWDAAPDQWELKVAACRTAKRDLDGRDGLFRFGPLSYMDRELCRRGCNGMTPEQIVAKLAGVVPDVKLFDEGVLIVAAEHFPEQSEIVATDRTIRARLGLPVWA